LFVYSSISMADTAHKILDATEALMAGTGFRRVTVDEIAQEAGVSRATIYLHYKSKEEIGLAYTDRIHRRLLDHLGSIANSNASAKEKLKAMLVGRVIFALDNAPSDSNQFNELFAAIRPAYMVRRETYFKNESDLFKAVLRMGRRRGEFEIENIAKTALALIMAMNGLMPFSLNQRQLKSRWEIEGLAELISDMLVSGLGINLSSSRR